MCIRDKLGRVRGESPADPDPLGWHASVNCSAQYTDDFGRTAARFARRVSPVRDLVMVIRQGQTVLLGKKASESQRSAADFL